MLVEVIVARHDQGVVAVRQLRPDCDRLHVIRIDRDVGQLLQGGYPHEQGLLHRGSGERRGKGEHVLHIRRPGEVHPEQLDIVPHPARVRALHHEQVVLRHVRLDVEHPGDPVVRVGSRGGSGEDLGGHVHVLGHIRRGLPAQVEVDDPHRCPVFDRRIVPVLYERLLVHRVERLPVRGQPQPLEREVAPDPLGLPGDELIRERDLLQQHPIQSEPTNPGIAVEIALRRDDELAVRGETHLLGVDPLRRVWLHAGGIRVGVEERHPEDLHVVNPGSIDVDPQGVQPPRGPGPAAVVADPVVDVPLRIVSQARYPSHLHRPVEPFVSRDLVGSQELERASHCDRPEQGHRHQHQP